MQITNYDTLDPRPNESASDNRDNRAVRTALRLISVNHSYKAAKDAKNEAVKDAIEGGFEVQDATGPRKINSKKMQQAYWKTASRVRPLDVAIHGAQRPEYMEKLVTDGVVTTIKKSGMVRALRDKGGVFQYMLGYGDGFMMFGTNTQSRGFPFKFTPVPNNNLYVDQKATSMRSGSKPVNRAAVITTYTWGEFVSLYPSAAKKAGLGRIPRDFNSLADLDQKDMQNIGSEDQVVEVCFFWDIANKYYVVFAGALCTVIEEKKGKEYPYIFKDKFTKIEEPYIPIFQLMCMESFEGFYNHGLLEAIYDIAVEYQRLLNMGLSHAEDVTYPHTVLSVPQGKSAEVFEQLARSNEFRAQGKKPMVTVEYSSTSGNQVGVQSLVSQNLLGETQVMWDMLDRECKRIGIHLDELEAANATATQILSDEENANAFVKQMMEKNASEFEFLYRVILDQIPKVISKQDKTPLESTVTLTIPVDQIKDKETQQQLKNAGKSDVTMKVGGTENRPEGITLGDLSEELSRYTYFAKVNARSGADMSKMKLAQNMEALRLAAPGSTAWKKIVTNVSQMRDIDISGEDFLAAAPKATPQTTAKTGEAPAQTERQSINVMASEPTAIF